MKKFLSSLFYKFLIMFRSFLILCAIIETSLLACLAQGFCPSLTLNPIEITAIRLTPRPEYVDLDFFLEFIAKKLNIVPTVDALVDAKIIQPSKKDFLAEHSSLSRAIIWRVIFPVYDLYPYPATFYPEFNLNSKYLCQIYLDSCATAFAYDLVTPSDSIYQYMPSAEFDRLIAFLETSPDLPEPSAPTNCPLINLNAYWTSETYLGRNSLLAAWDSIPENWREDFVQNYWRTSFSLPKIASASPVQNSYDGAAGVINYPQKTIFLNTAEPKTAFHEFTHFAVYRLGWSDDFLNPIFQHESDYLVGILNDYAFTSCREYLAEFVAYWLMHPNEQSNLASLAPQTSALTTKLTSSYISTAAP